MNAKLLAEETRAMIAKTRNLIQTSKAKCEHSKKHTWTTDPKEAERVYRLIFVPEK